MLDSERRVLNVLICVGFFALGYLCRRPVRSADAPASLAMATAHLLPGVLPEVSSRVARRDESGGAPYVLVGVISYPPNFEQRNLVRQFARTTGGQRGDGRVPGEGPHVATEYVFGDSYYGAPPAHAVQTRLADEAAQHGDVLFVNAREGIPNVGKASEKSAAWWLDAPKRSGARFFCKTDDDSLIHGAHLAGALAAAEKAAGGGMYIYISVSYYCIYTYSYIYIYICVYIYIHRPRRILNYLYQ